MLPFCLALMLTAPISSPIDVSVAGDALVAKPRRIEGASWREVAAAQVGQGALVPLEDDGVPDSGAIGLRIQVAGRPVELILDADGLWFDVGADGGAQLVELEEKDGFYETIALNEHGIPAGLMLYKRGDETRLTVQTHYHFEADLEVEGKPVRLYIIDMDLDGRASAGDQWLALDERQVACAELPALMFGSTRMDEPWYFGGEALLPVEYRADGSVAFALQTPERPRHEFLAERWARQMEDSIEYFEQTRDAFFDQFELERGRAVDPNPPAWYHAGDLTEAMAHAKASAHPERPLYVEFGNGGCPWCKRYGWLNYKDAEVTERLRRFTLVKIDRDLDPLQTARGLGLDGVPCHVVFDPHGVPGAEPIHKSNGWVGPEHHVDVLDEAWAAWEARTTKVAPPLEGLGG